MNRLFALFVIIVSLLFCTFFTRDIAAASSISNTSQLRINHDHSFIKFSIPYLKISEVEGQFRGFSGELTLDKNKQIREYQVTVLTKTIDTNNKLRDGHLNDAEFFNSKKNPTMVITYSNNEYVLEFGSQIIKKKMVLANLVIQKDTWGKVSYFQHLNTTISLKDFGFKWNKSLPGGGMILGDVVKVKAILQWQKKTEMTISNKHRIPETKALRKIRTQGNDYKELKPNMVTARRAMRNKGVSRKSSANVYVGESVQARHKPNLLNQLAILMGIIGIVGFYLMTRLYFSESRFPGVIIDLSFVTFLAIYLFLGWSFT